jgi:hypothetical protein
MELIIVIVSQPNNNFLNLSIWLTLSGSKRRRDGRFLSNPVRHPEDHCFLTVIGLDQIYFLITAVHKNEDLYAALMK